MNPARVALRLALAGGGLAVLAVHYGQALVEAWLPAYRAVFSWLMDDFDLLTLALDHEGADRVVRATVAWKPFFLLDGRVLEMDPRGVGNVSTLTAHALQGPLVMLTAAFAWPAQRYSEYPLRLLLLAPLLAILVLADVPCVLAGELWRTVLDALAPGTASPLLAWKSFVHGGGRYVLALVAALAAVRGGRSPTGPSTMPMPGA